MADESKEDRHNRELIELLNELRVALPGVQVLFAFLLAVPFANGFPKLGRLDRDIFFVAFIATALSTVLLIAPSSYHRLRWRQHAKERLRVVSNGLTIAGLACLAVAMKATKKMSRSSLPSLGKPFANGTASRNANSTWTPGNATRSSLRSSISSRSRRCSSVSGTATLYPPAQV